MYISINSLVRDQANLLETGPYCCNIRKQVQMFYFGDKSVLTFLFLAKAFSSFLFHINSFLLGEQANKTGYWFLH